MNSACITGHLTKDPEMHTTNTGIARCTFTVAVNRRFKNANGEREADFIMCVAWRQTAEFVMKYFRKGSGIGVVGSIQTRSYDAQHGTRRYVTELSVDNVEFFGAKKDSDAAAAPAQAAQVSEADIMGEDVFDDNDLPF